MVDGATELTGKELDQLVKRRAAYSELENARKKMFAIDVPTETRVGLHRIAARANGLLFGCQFIKFKDMNAVHAASLRARGLSKSKQS